MSKETLRTTAVPKLASLLEKMLGEFDREAGLALFHQIEEILSENMLHASWRHRHQRLLHGTRSLKNAQIPRDAYKGATPWMKHWWFGTA